MPRQVAAGLVMVRGDEVLLAHPGGPYFRRRDAGVWSIPKGLAEPGEELLVNYGSDYWDSRVGRGNLRRFCIDYL